MTLHVSSSAAFQYHPPSAAAEAERILVKPNLGYPVGHPATVSLGVLSEVLRSLREANPHGEILIVEGVCSTRSLADIVVRHGVDKLLDERMQLLDADALPLADYPNRSGSPVRFATMKAPALLSEVDCRISVGTFKRTTLGGEHLISASLKNLYGLFPRSVYKARSPKSRGRLHRPSVPMVLQDVYHCVGHLFEGAVVDGTERYISPDWKPDRTRNVAFAMDKVIQGDDLLAVDRRACVEAGEPVPDYIGWLQDGAVMARDAG
ncbi:MAG: DUF362 domain-containing protein [Myxococcota bacterium]